MESEFDENELRAIVEEALNPSTPPQTTGFSFGDTRVIERLCEVLPDYLSQTDTMSVIDQLRSELYDGINPGNLRDIHTTVKHCRKCPLMHNPQLPIWNLVEPDIIFVGESPWSESKADVLFKELLKAAGFTSKKIMYTSAVRCFSTESRGPNETELNTCSSRYLFSELQILKPKLIVAMGSAPASILLGNKLKITDDRGRIFWIGSWPILITYSASYVLRGRGEKDLASDLEKAFKFVYG